MGGITELKMQIFIAKCTIEDIFNVQVMFKMQEIVLMNIENMCYQMILILRK